MERINYKYSFMSLYILASFVFFIAIYLISSNSESTNVNSISVSKYYENFQNRQKSMDYFIDKYKQPLKAISQNSNFISYINNKKNKQIVKELFLTFVNSYDSIFQLRFIDINGNERIRVDKSSISKDKYISYVKEDSKLQNKSHRYYFKEFIKLDKGRVGISKIDLEVDNNKVILPKIASFRMARTLFNSRGEKIGVLVANLYANTLINTLTNSTFYDVSLIDAKGRFIKHYSDKSGVKSANFNTYTIKNEFGADIVKEILGSRSYLGENFYSVKLENLNTNQDLRLIIKLKYANLQKQMSEENITIYVIYGFLVLLGFPLVFIFAKSPQHLKNRIKKYKTRDELTNLPNRCQLFEDLKKSREDLIVVVKIDNYNKIKSAYGNETSQKLLLDCTSFLSSYIDGKVLKRLYKTDNDVFCFSVERCEKEEFKEIVSKLYTALENKEIDEFDILISIGTSFVGSIETSLNRYEQAELALEYGETNRKSITLYNEVHPSQQIKNKENLQRIKDLKEALREDRVIIQFQPIYNYNESRIDKYETLVRLDTPNGIIYPNEFIQVAKDINKYKTLTKIIIQKSFEYFKDKEYEFSINLTIEDICDEEIREYLFFEIKEYGVENRLVLEIVESEAIDNHECFFDFLKKCKEIGCKVAIDDFGSGYSNYEYILNLNEYVDYVKIDGSLITNIDKDPKVQLLVGSLKFICDTLQIKTIAEYVETREVFDFIESMGINYSQGYFIGKSVDETGTERVDFRL